VLGFTPTLGQSGVATYTIGPYQTSKRVFDPDQWGIQFGSLALNGLNIFGECIDHDWSCAISFKVVGCFY